MPLETCASNPFAVGNIEADAGTVTPPSYYYLRTAALSSAGVAAAAFVGSFTGSTGATFTSAGAATVSFVGESEIITESAFTSAGTATASFVGLSSAAAALSSAGAATVAFVGESTVADQWALVGSWTHSTNVAQVDFTGLAGYSEVRVLVRNVPASSGVRLLIVSTDNGSTFLTASGSYIQVSPSGVETNATYMEFLSGGALTSARSGEIVISGWNLTANKLAHLRTRTDLRQYVIPTASPLTALRVFDSAGVFSGGSIYVWAR